MTGPLLLAHPPSPLNVTCLALWRIPQARQRRDDFADRLARITR